MKAAHGFPVNIKNLEFTIDTKQKKDALAVSEALINYIPSVVIAAGQWNFLINRATPSRYGCIKCVTNGRTIHIFA